MYESAEDAFDDASVHVFRAGFESDPEENFSRVMAELDGGVWTYADYTLIVDEASFLQRPQAMHADLARLIRQAPDDITVIETLHRPSETHTTVRALATDAFFFQMYLPRDLDVVAEAYGSDVSEAVRHLGPHEVLHWWLGPAGNPTWCLWKDPTIWYVPIGGVMPEEKTTAPAELETPDNGAPDDDDETPDDDGAPATVETAPAPSSSKEEADEVRKQLKASQRELQQARDENTKLRRQLKYEKYEKPSKTETQKPAATAPVESSTTDKSVLEWLLS